MADTRIRWILDVVDHGAMAQLLRQDRQLRASLAQTDTAWRSAATSASTAGRQMVTAATRTTAATEKESRAVFATASALGKYNAAVKSTVASGSRAASSANAVSGALVRQRAEVLKLIAAEDAQRRSARTRLATAVSSGAQATGGAVRSGATAAVGAAATAGKAALGGAALVAGLTIWGTKQAAEVATAIGGLKGLAGLNAREAAALGIIAKGMNLNARSLGMAFGTLGKAVIGLEKGTKSSVEAFKALDISPAQVKALRGNLPALFDLVYERTQKLPAAERAGYMKQLLGRGGLIAGQIEQLGPLAQQMQAVQGATGGISTKELERLRLITVQAKIAVTELALSFAQTFGPPMIALLNALTPVIPKIGGLLHDAFQKPVEWLKRQMPAIKGFFAGLTTGVKTPAGMYKPPPSPKVPTQGLPPNLAARGGDVWGGVYGTRPVAPGGGGAPILPRPGYAPGQRDVKAKALGESKAGLILAPRDYGGVKPATPGGGENILAKAKPPDVALWTRIGQTVGRVLREIGEGALKYGKQLLDAFRPALPFFQNVLLPFAKGFGEALLFALRGVIPVVRTFANVLGFLGNLAKPIRPVFEALGFVVGTLFSGAVLKAVGIVGRAGAVMVSAFTRLSVVGQIVAKVAGWVGGLASKVGHAFGQAGSAVGRAVAGWASAAAGGIAHVASVIAGKVAGIAKDVFNGFWSLGRSIVGAIASGIKSAFDWVTSLLKGIAPRIDVGIHGGFPPRPYMHMWIGETKLFRQGGMVDAMVSPGEVVVYGGQAYRVPGAPTAGDTVHARLPVGAAVLTNSGQAMMGRGATLGEAVAGQRPHYQQGGFVATAYGPPWGGIEGGGVTATGVDLRRGQPAFIIAVDPRVIPLHSKVAVAPNPFGYTGQFAAEDTGGAIKGKRIDFYDWRGRTTQNAWGRRPVTVGGTGTSKAAAGTVGGGSYSIPLQLGASTTRGGLLSHAFAAGLAAGPEGSIVKDVGERLGTVTRTVDVGGASLPGAKAAGVTAHGLGTFDGMKVAAWIVPELEYARAHGWTGHITSGYRPGSRTKGGTLSMHALTDYPGGAIDFGGERDPAGAAARDAFQHATKGFHGARVKYPEGFRDDGHMSGTGHRRGGIVGQEALSPAGLLNFIGGPFSKRSLKPEGWQISAFFDLVSSTWRRLGMGGKAPGFQVDANESPRATAYTAGGSRRIHFPWINVLAALDFSRRGYGPLGAWKRKGIVHEMAHARQNFQTWMSPTLAEGGAEAFANARAPSAIAAPDTSVGYGRETAFVQRHKGWNWISRGQFMRRGGILGVMPRPPRKRAHAAAAFSAEDERVFLALTRGYWGAMGHLRQLAPGAAYPRMTVIPDGTGVAANNVPYTETGGGGVFFPHEAAAFALGHTKEPSYREWARQAILHEFAHTMQPDTLDRQEAEGGASAWAQIQAPKVGVRPNAGYGNLNAMVRKNKGPGWVAHGQFGFQRGGIVGGAITGQLKRMQGVATNRGAWEAQTTVLEAMLVNASDARLMQLRPLLIAAARRKGSAAWLRSVQAAISIVDGAIGKHAAALIIEAERYATAATRRQGALDRQLRAAGIDPTSAGGLERQAGENAAQVAARRRALAATNRAYNLAVKRGNKPEAEDLAAKVVQAAEDLDEAITKRIEDSRLALRATATEVADKSAFEVQQARNTASWLGNYQSLHGGQENPAAMMQRAATIEGAVIPALWRNVNAMKGTQAALEATGASAGDIRAAIGNVEQGSLDIGTAMVEAADLIRQAAETEAAEHVETRQHEGTMATIGLTNLELKQRIAGTTVTGAAERADYIRGTIIPAMEAERVELEKQKATAGNKKLADQIAESIASKQNDILQEIADATDLTAQNTEKNPVGGTLGFTYGSEVWTDALVGA